MKALNLRQPKVRNCVFKRAVRISVSLICHNRSVTTLSHALSMATVAKQTKKPWAVTAQAYDS